MEPQRAQRPQRKRSKWLPNKAAKAFHKHRNVEIHDQANTTATCLQIGQDLRLMNSLETPHCLYLNDDRVFDEQVEAMRADRFPAVLNKNRLLCLYIEFSMS